MAKEIKVSAFTENDNGSFTATGTVEGESFVAKTIVYRGEPIFKLQESNEKGELDHLRLDTSTFDRGTRIAVARHLKQVRLGEVAVDGPSLEDLTVAQLRLKAKELDVDGWRSGDVRKADLVALVESAENTSVTAQA
jgi:hypothetical protein